MKNSLVVIWLLIGLGWSHSVEAKPQSARYMLIVQEIKGDSDKMVSLRDNQTKRTLWTRKIGGPQATWSKDRRAVAVESADHLLVWREGYALRDFGIIKGFDYTMRCVWSPDNQRLLVRFGFSGSGDMDAGTLLCLKLGSRKFYKYSVVAYSVRNMRWRDSQTVLYRVVNFAEDGHETVSKQLKWHVR